MRRRALGLAAVTAPSPQLVEVGSRAEPAETIARAAAMSPANLYRYFRNKQAIGLAMVEAYRREERDVIERALSACDGDAPARLRAHAEASVGFLVAHLREAPRLVELAEMLHETEQGRAVIEAHVVAVLEQYAGIIAEGVAEGSITPPPALADPLRAANAAMLALRYFHAPIALSRHGVGSVEADLAATLDLVCAGLGARHSRAAPPS